MLRDESVGVEATWCGVERETGHDVRCEQVHRRLKRIVKARGALDAQEAEALREAEQVRVWRHYGYGSLLEYMEMEMGYTPRAALERLRVAKAIVELPAIADAMAQGDLSFSAGRELTRVATPETEAQWLEATGDLNMRDVEHMVSGRRRGDKPNDPADPKLRTRPVRFDEIDDETRALVRQARQILERELGERMSDGEVLRTFARMVIDGAAAPERARAPYQIAVTICERCQRGWQAGGGITVEMSPATIETALCDAQHIGSIAADASAGPRAADAAEPGADADTAGTDAAVATRAHAAAAARAAAKTDADAHVSATANTDADAHVSATANTDADAHVGAAAKPVGPKSVAPKSVGPKSVGPKSVGPKSVGARTDADAGVQAVAETSNPNRARSAIPPALRRKVKHRDQGRCRVHWCRSARNCDQHHILPIAQGGTHTLENLITLCESHHLAHHAGSLLIEGTASTARFTRRAQSSFAIAERAVETASALKNLGYDRREVRTAMEKTRTHVGNAELPLEQWIRIALTYCARPR